MRTDRQPGEPRPRRREFVWREAEPVHAGIQLDVDADRIARRRCLEQAHLLLVMHDHGEPERPRSGDVRRSEESFEQQNGPRPAGSPRAARLVEVDQREAICLCEPLHRALDSVTVRVGLDHGPHLAPGRTGACGSEVVSHCIKTDTSVDRTWHGMRERELSDGRSITSTAHYPPQPACYNDRVDCVRQRRTHLHRLASPARTALPPRPMNRGFYTIMAAQFLSSLADNALLIAAIALLREMGAASWMTPMLKLFFVISYVGLAAFVGAFADSFPKGRVMLVTNTIKIGGCLLMFIGVHPLLAYAVVGFGAAAYSPAKYGIVTELLPPERLVVANGWIEGLTVISIILGFLLGGVLISPKVSAWLLAFDAPMVDLEIDHPAESAIAVIAGIYVAAAFVNILIPDTGARYAKQHVHPWKLLVGFAHCCNVLWRDKLGQISLAVTTLFWGAGATLQFIVLKWAEQVLGLNLSQAAILQAIVAVGIAFGAVYAASRVSLKSSLGVLPVGVAMGVIVALASLYSRNTVPDGSVQLGMFTASYFVIIACLILMVIGALAGYFVVPMNALLQHRGHVLLSAGHSIAVQNFNENLSILVMLGLYALLIWLNLSIQAVMLLFGLFVAVSMVMVMLRHRYNQRQFDSVALIGEARH